MNKYFKEFILWAFIILPYVYLATIWNELPAQVPTHFNIDGVADDWSAKTTLLFVPSLLAIGIYCLLLIMPLLDPKKRIQEMGDKYFTLRFMLTVFFSILSTYLLYVSKEGELNNPNILFALIGSLFAMLGNYFQTIRPNYFIGIRTPWTLESESVWKKTHRLGGQIWITGGVLIVMFAFFMSNRYLFAIVFGIIICLMVIVPVVFSYTEFQKAKKNMINL